MLDQQDRVTPIYRWANENDLTQIVDLLMVVRGDRQDVTANQFLIASLEDLVIGCVRVKNLTDGTQELASLCVQPKYRNLGVGEQLVKSILSYSKKRPIYLLCFDNMLMFYKKFGFVQVDPNILPDCLGDEYRRVSVSFAPLDDKVVAMRLL